MRGEEDEFALFMHEVLSQESDAALAKRPQFLKFFPHVISQIGVSPGGALLEGTSAMVQLVSYLSESNRHNHVLPRGLVENTVLVFRLLELMKEPSLVHQSRAWTDSQQVLLFVVDTIKQKGQQELTDVLVGFSDLLTTLVDCQLPHRFSGFSELAQRAARLAERAEYRSLRLDQALERPQLDLELTASEHVHQLLLGVLPVVVKAVLMYRQRAGDPGFLHEALTRIARAPSWPAAVRACAVESLGTVLAAGVLQRGPAVVTAVVHTVACVLLEGHRDGWEVLKLKVQPWRMELAPRLVQFVGKPGLNDQLVRVTGGRGEPGQVALFSCCEESARSEAEMRRKRPREESEEAAGRLERPDVCDLLIKHATSTLEGGVQADPCTVSRVIVAAKVCSAAQNELRRGWPDLVAVGVQIANMVAAESTQDWQLIQLVAVMLAQLYSDKLNTPNYSQVLLTAMAAPFSPREPTGAIDSAPGWRECASCVLGLITEPSFTGLSSDCIITLMKRALGSDSPPELQLAGLGMMPRLVLKLEPRYMASVRDMLCRLQPDQATAQSPNLSVEDEKLMEKLAGTIGLVACAAAQPEPGPPEAKFSCPVCDNTSAEPQNKPQSGRSTSLLGIGSWRRLCDLLHPDVPKGVRLECVKALRRIFGHSQSSEIVAARTQMNHLLEIFMHDSDPEIREEMCLVFPCVLSCEQELDQVILNALIEARQGEGSVKPRMAMMRSLGAVGSVATGPHFVATMQALMDELGQTNQALRNAAYNQILTITQNWSMRSEGAEWNPLSLVSTIKKMIAQHDKDGLIPMYLAQALGNQHTMMVDEVLDALFGDTPQEYFQRKENLVAAASGILKNKALWPLLDDIGRVVKSSPKTILVENRQIVIQLLRQADDEKLLEQLQHVEQITCSKLGDWMRDLGFVWKILDTFIPDLGQSETCRVLQAQQILQSTARMVFEGSSADTDSACLSQFASQQIGSDPEHLKELLDRDFLYIMHTCIEPPLNKASGATASKSQVVVEEARVRLRSLSELCKLMGSSILSAYVPKVIVALKHVLEHQSDSSICEAALDAFLTFVRELTPSNVGHSLSQIVVIVLEHVHTHASKAIAVLELLIVHGGPALEDQFEEILFIPSTATVPALRRVNEALSKVTESLSLERWLEITAGLVAHESEQVSVMALSRLERLLHENRSQIHTDYVMQADRVSPVIETVLQVLLRAANNRFGLDGQLLITKCLGELGAIDPARVNVLHISTSKVELRPEQLAVALIESHLVKMVRGARNRDDQALVNFAIQELLRYLGCDHTDQSATETVLQGFEESTQVLIRPCAYSHYNNQDKKTQIDGTVYAAGMTFQEWIYEWIKRMVAVSDSDYAAVFTACALVLKLDTNLALYLLPYVVFELLDAEGRRHLVRTEIMQVFKSHMPDHDQSFDSSTTRPDSKPVDMEWQLCVQAIFTLLDTLKEWSDRRMQEACDRRMQSQAHRGQPSQATTIPEKISHVQDLHSAISYRTLASASFACGAYARALQYFELHLRGQELGTAWPPALASRSGLTMQTRSRFTGEFSAEDVEFLQSILSKLEDSDALTGLVTLRPERELPKPGDLALHFQQAGVWSEVVRCYEFQIQHDSKDLQAQTDMVTAQLAAGQLRGALLATDGLIAQSPEHASTLAALGISAAWRLGDWTRVDQLAKRATPSSVASSVEVLTGRALSALHNKQLDRVSAELAEARRCLMAPIAAASMESYRRVYPMLVSLHMLQEIEQAVMQLAQDSTCLPTSQLLHAWKERLESIESTDRAVWEPVSAVRRVLLPLVTGSAHQCCNEVTHLWLQTAQLARSAGQLETAASALLQVEAAAPGGGNLAPGVALERAKWHWDRLEFDAAMFSLRKHLDDPSLDANRRASALLQLAHWGAEKNTFGAPELVERFKEAIDLAPKGEMPYFSLAKFYDRLYTAHGQTEAAKGNHPEKNIMQDLKYFKVIIEHYGESLKRGHSQLFHSMPRMLTLWLKAANVDTSKNREGEDTKTAINSIMAQCQKSLPAYQWYTALPQLISRICEPNIEAHQLIGKILSNVVIAYPAQSLWSVVAAGRSKNQQRRSRALSVLQSATKMAQMQARKSSQNSIKDLIQTCQKMVDCVIELCNLDVDVRKSRRFSISSKLKTLHRIGSLGVVMPLQSSFSVTLPPSGQTDRKHVAFALDQPTLSKFEDEVEVLHSLQKPKKLKIIGSDGKSYTFLCKPKDDLRKDSRMMDLNSTINRFFRRDPASRRRNLHVRTYAVVPLNEDCGLIEWVPSTVTFRSILQKLYQQAGLYKKNSQSEIKSLYDKFDKGQTGLSRVDFFSGTMLRRFPPVMHRWLLNSAADPNSWLTARRGYTTTLAVMSIIGHVVGLGDRHGENILFDSSNGDAVHVDFSCLFEQGKTLQIAERVPFRLTANIVDGLGVTGTEGAYRRVCEVTMRTLRNNQDTLMNVLETFVHDPLVEWAKAGDISSRIMAKIEAKFKGKELEESEPFSVEGQVHYLINEATSLSNLSEMYIWWMPWW